MAEELLRLPAVKARTGLSRSSLYEMVRAKAFPAPIRPYGTKAMVAWVASEVDSWVDERVRAARPDRDAVPV